jgi:hypothetical protein
MSACINIDQNRLKLHTIPLQHKQSIKKFDVFSDLLLQGGVQGYDVFHIPAVGEWFTWGKQMMCAHICLHKQFSSHGEPDGESSCFCCVNLF